MTKKLSNWWRRGRQFSAKRADNTHKFPMVRVMRPSASEFPERPRILVLKLDHIGDFVLAMRAFLELRTAWPNALITLICGPWNCRLAQRAEIFDRVIDYSFFPESASDNQRPTAALYSKFAKFDVGGPYDIAIDMRYDDDTRPLLAMVDAKFRAGYAAKNINLSLDLELPTAEKPATGEERYSRPLHAELQMLVLVSTLINYFRQREPHPICEMLPKAGAIPGLSDQRSIVVAPGAGKTTSQWPLKNFAALCAALTERTAHNLLLVGNQGDIEKGRIISASLPPDRVCDLTDKLPIEELPELLSNVALFVGNDSGATHMAAKLGAPTICIFSGAADYRIWQPIGPNVKTIRTEIECAPCDFMRREHCPIGVKCLSSIAVDDVLNTALGMLSASKAIE